MQGYKIKYRGGISGVIVMAIAFFVVFMIPFALLLLPTMYELVPKETE